MVIYRDALGWNFTTKQFIILKGVFKEYVALDLNTPHYVGRGYIGGLTDRYKVLLKCYNPKRLEQILRFEINVYNGLSKIVYTNQNPLHFCPGFVLHTCLFCTFT